jgi:uncharacterized protein YdiU (UPF0061 family)
MIDLEYSYLSLPNTFYQKVRPSSFSKPALLLLNQTLLDELQIKPINPEVFLSFLLNQEADEAFGSFAQAYAGHQFGHFTKLGDGRAIVIGEYVGTTKQRYDLQIKGSGRTAYSRGGDGKATLKSVLREYLMSEAMHALRVQSSRSLAVVKTGEMVQREIAQEGAFLLRLMKSHIRVGTFEYARHYGSSEDMKALLDYTIQRLYPEIKQEENQALALLKKVMLVQIDLVVDWMRIGFIHGVMNTDNTAISGETFDYGPCAFMNVYHPQTVFSSIDTQGRYAFGNQPNIIKWNLAKFAEALLPLLHPEPEIAVKLAQGAIDEFEEIWYKKYYTMMLLKLGIADASPENYSLVNELQVLMKALKLDYTNTFLALTQNNIEAGSPMDSADVNNWLEKWKLLIQNATGMAQAKKIMEAQNPAFIPRNYLVEEALEKATAGDFTQFEQFLKVLQNPYQYQESLKQYTIPPAAEFETSYATFCGT